MMSALAPRSSADDRKNAARRGNKLEDTCRQQYLDGKYDQALENCLKAKELFGGSNLKGLLGAMYARKGDMQQAYDYWYWVANPDNGTMSGIPDPQARLAAQSLARRLAQYAGGTDVDYKARGISAADGLAIILRKYGFEEDANKVEQEGTSLRRAYTADRASVPSTFSAIMSGLATGMAGVASQPMPSSTSPQAPSGGGLATQPGQSADEQAAPCLAKCRAREAPYEAANHTAIAAYDSCFNREAAAASAQNRANHEKVVCSAEYQNEKNAGAAYLEIQKQCLCYGSVK